LSTVSTFDLEAIEITDEGGDGLHFLR
ncbi:MAG: hypothetical protein JWP01_1077, partial [Myxococcales bacterium]|nr:hypothetical protein [Myxococcales bacterium]